MKRIKKPLALSRETVRPLVNNALRGVHGAVIMSRNTCVPVNCASVPQTGCTSCPSCGDCGLLTSKCF